MPKEFEHLDDTDMPGVAQPTARDTINPPVQFSYLFIGEHRLLLRARRTMAQTERPDITTYNLRIAGKPIAVRSRPLIVRVPNG